MAPSWPKLTSTTKLNALDHVTRLADDFKTLEEFVRTGDDKKEVSPRFNDDLSGAVGNGINDALERGFKFDSVDGKGQRRTLQKAIARRVTVTAMRITHGMVPDHVFQTLQMSVKSLKSKLEQEMAPATEESSDETDQESNASEIDSSGIENNNGSSTTSDEEQEAQGETRTDTGSSSESDDGQSAKTCTGEDHGDQQDPSKYDEDDSDSEEDSSDDGNASSSDEYSAEESVLDRDDDIKKTPVPQTGQGEQIGRSTTNTSSLPSLGALPTTSPTQSNSPQEHEQVVRQSTASKVTDPSMTVPTSYHSESRNASVAQLVGQLPEGESVPDELLSKNTAEGELVPVASVVQDVPNPTEQLQETPISQHSSNHVLNHSSPISSTLLVDPEILQLHAPERNVASIKEEFSAAVSSSSLIYPNIEQPAVLGTQTLVPIKSAEANVPSRAQNLSSMPLGQLDNAALLRHIDDIRAIIVNRLDASPQQVQPSRKRAHSDTTVFGALQASAQEPKRSRIESTPEPTPGTPHTGSSPDQFTTL